MVLRRSWMPASARRMLMLGPSDVGKADIASRMSPLRRRSGSSLIRAAPMTR